MYGDDVAPTELDISHLPPTLSLSLCYPTTKKTNTGFQSILSLLCRKSATSSVSLYLSLSLDDVAVRDGKGGSPLAYAVARGRVEVVRLLLHPPPLSPSLSLSLPPSLSLSLYLSPT